MKCSGTIWSFTGPISYRWQASTQGLPRCTSYMLAPRHSRTASEEQSGNSPLTALIEFYVLCFVFYCSAPFQNLTTYHLILQERRCTCNRERQGMLTHVFTQTMWLVFGLNTQWKASVFPLTGGNVQKLQAGWHCPGKSGILFLFFGEYMHQRTPVFFSLSPIC